MEQRALVAESLARDIKRIASRAKSEEDLKIGVEKLLEPALQGLGLRFTPQYEKTVLRGSADAVYGHVTIEYEKPGKLATKAGVEETTAQLAKYLLGDASKYGPKKEEALGRMVGISLDGHQILFFRYSRTKRGREFPMPALPGAQLSFFEEPSVKGGFQVMGPYPVTTESISVFILYLRSLARKPLTPEALAKDFGPQGEVARQAVNTFYEAFQAAVDNPRVQTFFGEWERIFGIVYGEDLAKAERDAQELAKLYQTKGKIALKPLLFAVHTYYALLMKFLAMELASLQSGSLVSSFVADLPALTGRELKDRLTDLEKGGTFALLGIKNFLEGDFFGWYLDIWDNELAGAVRAVARELGDFEPATSTLEPESTRDLLKKLYQYLVPKRLRHDLGEYYTPDWLAERLLNQVGYDGDPTKRLIDPGCGSGTFLVLALRRMRQYAQDKLIDPKTVIEAALKNIVGFDLNPLAVIAARTNYLLALGDLIRYKRPIEIPIYMCDSILTPTAYADLFAKGYRLHTVVGDFDIPSETVEWGEIDKLTALLEECVAGEYTRDEFLARAERSLSMADPTTAVTLGALYDKLLELERSGHNGIWARLLKNAFAPILVGKFDYVVGNPPWVNWESLAEEYREATKALWVKYGLFSLKGWRARLGGGKKDLAMLFAYASIDHYLKKGGKLGFVITQTLFKTKGAGAGFRRFRLGDKEPLRVIYVDDMVALQPFEGATNRTSVFVCQRGAATKYPVPYTLWKKQRGVKVGLDDTLEEVIATTSRANLQAKPIDAEEITSPWITARPKALRALKKVIGNSEYQARAGCCTWANGVYWLDIIAKRPDGLIVIDNLHKIGRRKIKSQQAAIEPDLVYPLLRGRDIMRWKATPSAYILMVQDPDKRVGYDESWLKLHYPQTYAYLKYFEKVLRERSGYRKYFDVSKDSFYSLYNVGPYTLSTHKVVWKALARKSLVAVISELPDKWFEGKKAVIPEHNTIFVAVDSAGEAHYLCAILNSAAASLTIQAYSSLFYSTHVLDHINVPRYNLANPLHQELSQLSQRAHELAAAGDEEGLREVEEEIDEKAADLWGITKGELREIRRSLEELG